MMVLWAARVGCLALNAPSSKRSLPYAGKGAKRHGSFYWPLSLGEKAVWSWQESTDPIKMICQEM